MSESPENNDVHCAVEAQRKLAQHHLERIRKEEEEEQWISGEELYTEGSSDEDDAAFRAKRRGKAARKNRRATPSKAAKRKEEKPVIEPAASLEMPTTSKSSNHVKNPEAVLNVLTPESELESLSLSDEGMASRDKSGPSTSSGLQAESEHVEISWRPKRGSIKLPNINPEDVNGERAKNIDRKSNWTFSEIFENMDKPQECMFPSGFPDSANEIFKTVEAFCISNAQSDQPRPQSKKSCNGETPDLQSAFLEMEKYDNLLEFMAKKEREAREATNKLLLHTKKKLSELNGSQKLSGQLAKNFKSFVQLHTEEKNDQDKTVVLPSLNGDNTKKITPADFKDQCCLSKLQKQGAEAEQRPKTTGDEMKKKSVSSRRVQSATTQKKKEVNFIQRNIESVVSTNVTEALTEEEKQQLSVLLKEIEGMKGEFRSSGDTVSENGLCSKNLIMKPSDTPVISVKQTRIKLLEENIDSETALVTLSQAENEKIKHLLEEEEEEIHPKYKYASSDQKLQDIDQALAALTTTALEEVGPVDEDKIKDLIAGYYKDCKINPLSENQAHKVLEEDQSSSKSILDEETLKQLLDQAYKDLPNFKYRYKV